MTVDLLSKSSQDSSWCSKFFFFFFRAILRQGRKLTIATDGLFPEKTICVLDASTNEPVSSQPELTTRRIDSLYQTDIRLAAFPFFFQVGELNLFVSGIDQNSTCELSVRENWNLQEVRRNVDISTCKEIHCVQSVMILTI